jgi:hypothetical protein
MLQYFCDDFNACFGVALLWAVGWTDGESSQFQTYAGRMAALPEAAEPALRVLICNRRHAHGKQRAVDNSCQNS